MFHTEICDLLGIRYPILQGAMQGAGGPDLVAATSEAGGLGILPTFGGTEEALYGDIEAARKLTDKPVAVNITPMGRAFTESRAKICVEMEVPIVTTGRADPGEAAVGTMKDAGIIVIPVIPTVEHALRVQAEGVDAVIASGNEAGMSAVWRPCHWCRKWWMPWISPCWPQAVLAMAGAFWPCWHWVLWVCSWVRFWSRPRRRR